MSKPSNIYEINALLDAQSLHTQFAKSKRLQIPNFLPTETANTIEAVLNKLEWRLVLNENGKHFDIHPLQIKALGAEKTTLIVEAAKHRRLSGFQYLYENYPITDMAASGNLKNQTLKRLLATMNSKSVLKFLNTVTEANVEFCDMQGTCYRAGHFLTRHDDGNPGKNRKFAYVYSLCRDWQAEYGGALEFFDEDGDIEASFIPQYNTLSIFSVPIPHHVTPVDETVTTGRYSVTGWFRTTH